MQTITRHSPWLIGAATMVLVIAGCDQGNRETSGAPESTARAQTAQASTPDLDEAEDRVEDALRADSALGAFRLDADDEDERLVIEGVVETEAQKTRAAEIAAAAAPGLSLDDRLRVDSAAARGGAADAAADEAEDRIEDAFDADSTLGALDLDADDEDGRLVLKGTVLTDAERSRAEEVAAGVAPGIRIDNQIRVE